MSAAPQPAEDGNLPAALVELEDAVAALVEEGHSMAGRPDCPDCHNQDCEPDCTLHTCPGHLTPTADLYAQLYDAVNEGRTGASTSGSRPRSLPTGWIDAQQVLDEIDTAVGLWQPTPVEAEDMLTPARLRAMLKQKYRPQDVKGLEQKITILKAWVKDIQDLFDPPSVKHISAPCPACGATTAYKKDSAGERVRIPALQIVSERGCTCQVCRYCWPPEHYLHLCRVLGFEMPTGVLE